MSGDYVVDQEIIAMNNNNAKEYQSLRLNETDYYDTYFTGMGKLLRCKFSVSSCLHNPTFLLAPPQHSFNLSSQNCGGRVTSNVSWNLVYLHNFNNDTSFTSCPQCVPIGH